MSSFPFSSAPLSEVSFLHYVTLISSSYRFNLPSPLVLLVLMVRFRLHPCFFTGEIVLIFQAPLASTDQLSSLPSPNHFHRPALLPPFSLPRSVFPSLSSSFRHYPFPSYHLILHHAPSIFVITAVHHHPSPSPSLSLSLGFWVLSAVSQGGRKEV